MVSIYKVDPNKLIEEVAQELKKSEVMTPPEWSAFVKTGISRERPPENPDWWYVRAASVLRFVYREGPIGVSKLKTKYGSKKNRGYAPEKFKKASGNILRTILQQLEKEGYLIQSKDKKERGRMTTPKGQSLLEKSASKVFSEQNKQDSGNEAAEAGKEDKKDSKSQSKKAKKEDSSKEEKPKKESSESSDDTKKKSEKAKEADE